MSVRTWVILLTLCAQAVPSARSYAQVCGDADGNGSITVTDGVQVLRAAAGLLSGCNGRLCDVDGSGNVTVTDGVNVLRAAAGLSVNLSCTSQGRFVDNGDGTVTDNQTGLQWEKKTGTVGTHVDCSREPCPDAHDVNNGYQWCLNADHDFDCNTDDNPPDGGAFTDFLVALNTPPCFAGHCDWRLPKSGGPPFWTYPSGEPAELESLLLAPYPCGTIPCIDPIFGPTVAGYYWTATTHPTFTDVALTVNFDVGVINQATRKAVVSYARAVRAGS
jgi:hypothetical protein